MLLWRLSAARFADRLDGGYGLHNEGRWNSIGKLVTYTSMSPAMCVLETLVHIEDIALMPKRMMIEIGVPEDIKRTNWSDIVDLPISGWTRNQDLTRKVGNDWYDSKTSALLIVPSAIAYFEHTLDLNVIINHSHPDAARIGIAATNDFEFDLRLL